MDNWQSLGLPGKETEPEAVQALVQPYLDNINAALERAAAEGSARRFSIICVEQAALSLRVSDLFSERAREVFRITRTGSNEYEFDQNTADLLRKQGQSNQPMYAGPPDDAFVGRLIGALQLDELTYEERQILIRDNLPAPDEYSAAVDSFLASLGSGPA